MRDIQAALFGAYPRRVGTPAQHWVFNDAQLDVFLDTVRGSRNCYATVGQLPVTEAGAAVSDKVFFDLDGDKSPFAEATRADERRARLRADPDLADAVLGAACEDARKLARASRDDGIPAVGVFSGFGVHVHQLYQRTDDPAVPMTTCAARYIDQLDLQTADWAVVGQVERLCRVPNMPRTTHREDRHGKVQDGAHAGVWTVPLSRGELAEITPGELLALSTAPRACPDPVPAAADRPQMPVWEEYKSQSADSDAVDVPQRPFVYRSTLPDGDGLEALLKELLRMPCVCQRLVQPNPEHEVRFTAAVILFNVGLTPRQVEDIYARLGWVDFDRETTRKHLQSIYRTGYSEYTCRTMRSKRLCVKDEAPTDCDCYGWSGTECEWL
jgi:hypothetical protein